MEARRIPSRLRPTARHLCRRLAGAVVAVALVSAVPAKALTINIDAPALAGTDALAAFERAAQSWERVFSDPIEVNIEAALLPLGSSSVIGQTSSTLLEGSYDLIRNAMVADALSESDDGIVAYLPGSSQFTAIVLDIGTGVIGLNGGLSATKANLKALGFDLDAAFGALDATIEFNSEFQFDFDRSDGVAPGLTDFETVAAHEIGHVLGFDSVVDTVDILAAFGIAVDIAPRTLDLFRFQEGDEPTTPAEFTTAARLLVPGFPDFDPDDNLVDQFPAVFSDVDTAYPMSTGVFFGDARQASHWKDDNYTGVHIGLMDPSLGSAEVFEITAADIRALDLIGWDYDTAVGEPPSAVLLVIGLLAGLMLASRAGVSPLRRGSWRRSRRRPWKASRSTECVRAPLS